MKIKHLILLATFASLLFTVNACKSEDEPDDNDPVLTITSPTDNESFLGQIHIALNATDESLHEMSIKVTRDDDGWIAFEAAPEVHDLTTFNYDTSFAATGVTGLTDMTLTVEVEDHDSHIVTKTVKFTAQ